MFAVPYGTVAQSLTDIGACDTAQVIADRNGAPVAIVMDANGYFLLEQPDDMDTACEWGWTLYAVVDPTEAEA